MAALATVAIVAATALDIGVAPARAATTTFSKDVAPIIFSRCGSCHRPGGSGPFSLLTYAAARPRAGQLAAVTRSRQMPPWKAEPGHGDFLGLTPLTADEIGVFERWVADGATEGDERDLPPLPKWPDGWQLGQPDLIVTSEPYTLQASGNDVFRILVLPLPVKAAAYVRGMEFRPGNPAVVHHATIRIDRTPTSRRLADEDPGAGYSGLIARTAGYPDGHFLGWTPGQVPPLLPKGLAWHLNRGTDLVVELHMQPSGKPEVVQPSVGFFFGTDPPDRTPTMLRLGRQNLDIGPGERYVMTDSFVLPVDVEVQAVQPHAHYRAREVTAWAVLPDSTTTPVVTIRNWDFRWQHVYRYVSPVSLPRGTTLHMRYTYDNSPANLRIPAPPSRVLWGQRSADEMGDLWVQVLTRSEDDRRVLNDAFRPKMLAEDIIGYQSRLKREPASASLHDDVALLYLEMGRANEAVTHFTLSAALKPESAAAHYNVGVALAAAGRMDEAILKYRAALAVNPNYGLASNNLGSALLQRGQLDEAAALFRAAIKSDSEHASAHHNLGTVYRLRGSWREAEGELERAVQLQPDDSRPLGDLAMLLAAAPVDAVRNPRRAVMLAERAAAVTRRGDASILDVLAAAYASAGSFDRAVETSQAALDLGPSPALAAQIRARQALYKQRRTYRLEI
jgi:Flp pilus assembly protein TadD